MKKIRETKLHAIPYFPAGSFAVHIGDHFRSNLGIISGVGIICGPGSFAALYSSIYFLTCCVELTSILVEMAGNMGTFMQCA